MLTLLLLSATSNAGEDLKFQLSKPHYFQYHYSPPPSGEDDKDDKDDKPPPEEEAPPEGDEEGDEGGGEAIADTPEAALLLWAADAAVRWDLAGLQLAVRWLEVALEP